MENDMRRERREGVDDRGAAMLEMALVLPLLVVLLFGIIEFGRAFNMVISMQNASRETARELALGVDRTSAINAGIDSAPSAQLVASNFTRATECADTAADGATAEVRIEKSFDFNIPFVRLSTTLHATAEMRCGL